MKRFSMSLKLGLILLVLILSYAYVSAQSVNEKFVNPGAYQMHKKGDVYITWGYNRSWYNNSDIHFTGQGHDFILYAVSAQDRPSPLSSDYVNITTWSTPQFNFRVGWFLTDKYSISLGTDHMKYVMDGYQTVDMFGSVFPDMAVDPVMKENMHKLNDQYAPNGLYNDVPVQLIPVEVVSYEHTDGFNYISLDIERNDELWQYSKYDRLGLTFVSGLGLGTILPRTDARLFGSGANHYWNFAGWGANAKVALQINFLRKLYLESNFKLGWVHMSNVHTTNHYKIDKAQQNIVFYESNVVLGFIF